MENATNKGHAWAAGEGEPSFYEEKKSPLVLPCGGHAAGGFQVDYVFSSTSGADVMEGNRIALAAP